MNRPYIVCHMVTSIDGKVTGSFLHHAACKPSTAVYYAIHRRCREQGAGGFLCGRVTMEESFTGGWYPDLSAYEPMKKEDGHYRHFLAEELSGYYAVAFDPKGKLGWKQAFIQDDDPGYDNAQIIEVLTEQADARYLTYLQEHGISYIIAGETEMDVASALNLLTEHLSPTRYLLEGGSIINGHFLRADCVDELCLVQAPVTADAEAKPLFMSGTAQTFEPIACEIIDGIPVLRYKHI